MDDELDIAVVGAGPAGLLAACEAARHGLDVAVFEEDSIVGMPEKCAGLYSLDGLKKLRIPLHRAWIQNFARGALFKSPSGRTFLVDASRDIAVIANRERFDQYLAEQAVMSGASLYINTRVSSARIHNDGIELNTRRGVVRASYLIDSEGHSAFIARSIHPSYKLGEWLPIIQYQVAGHGMDRQLVYLFFKHYLPDFFAYLVPIDDELGKVGIAAKKNIRYLASKFMAEEFPNARVVGVQSSAIYVGPPLDNPRVGRAYFVGDVAGHVKATTGGGVIFGGMAGMAAAREIALGDDSFKKYVKNAYRELHRIYLVRRLTAKLKPNQLDMLFRLVSESGIDRKLSEMGDMDFHGSTATRLITTREFLKLAPLFLKSLIVS